MVYLSEMGKRQSPFDRSANVQAELFTIKDGDVASRPRARHDG